MELLGPGRVGSLGWLILHCSLESEDEAGRCVQRCPVIAQCPSPILLTDGSTEQCLVELGQFRGNRTVQHRTLQVSDHETILSGRRGHAVIPARAQ